MSRFMALWRGIWIVLMLALLFVSTLATFNDYWLYSFGTPSVCVWENIPGTYRRQPSALVLITVFAILWGGVDVIYGFFPSRSLSWIVRPVDFLAVVMLALTALPIFVYQRLRDLEASPASTIRRFAYRALRIICYPPAVLMAVAVQLLTSRMLDLLRVWFMGLFYSSNIFFIRELAPRAGLMNDEDGWAFGRAAAVSMLLLPFFGIIEAFLGQSVGIAPKGERRC